MYGKNCRLLLTFIGECPSNRFGVCSGQGVCGPDVCECDPGRTYLDCSSTPNDPLEIYHGVLFGKKFYPRATQPFQTYLVVSPTNKDVTVKLSVYSGTAALFSNLVKGRGHISVDTNGTYEFGGLMKMFIEFGDPPVIPMYTSPGEYPVVIVDVDEAKDPIYEFTSVSKLYKVN
jgi:hypothetical protein